MEQNTNNFEATQTRVHTASRTHLQTQRIITGFEPGKWLESYKMLRTRCLQIMDANNWNTLAITSPNTKSGNSLTATNLAISIAMEFNRNVLLVDANIQNPGICNLLNIKTKSGLSDYLTNNTPINDLLISIEVDGITILPSGNAILNSAEMLRSPKMLALISELKNKDPNRIIIFDLPPLLSQDDTLGFIPAVDCTLLVVDEGHTKMEELKHSANLLKDINVLGTILNKATANKIQYQIN